MILKRDFVLAPTHILYIFQTSPKQLWSDSESKTDSDMYDRTCGYMLEGWRNGLNAVSVCVCVLMVSLVIFRTRGREVYKERKIHLRLHCACVLSDVQLSVCLRANPTQRVIGWSSLSLEDVSER